MRNLRSIFTPHRLLQVGTDLTLVGSAVSGLVGVMPAGWQNTALVGLGVLGKAATFIKSLAGNSRWETSPVGQRLLSGQPVSLADVEKLVERAVRWEMSNAVPPAPLAANAGGVAASAVLSSTFGPLDPRGQDTTPPPAPVDAPVPDIPDAPLPPPGLDAPPPDPAPAAAPAPATGTQGQPGA